MKTQSAIIFLFMALIVSGCSSQPDSDPYAENATLEEFNRFGWTVNQDYLDPYLVRPVSVAYMEYTPPPVQSMMSNFLYNLDEPSNFINNLLMGNLSEAKNNFDRFLINSTVGLFGLIDLATHNEVPESVSRDFGDVLGYYGVGQGPYVMVPLYGPWTLRGMADQVDMLYSPLAWLNWIERSAKWGVQGLETRYNLIPQEPMLLNSPDPYALSRRAYLDYKDHKAETKPEEEEVIDEALLEEYLD